mgnify:CR=1 FL=1
MNTLRYTLLILFVISTNALATNEETWKKYLCELQKATRYVDGGILEEEERSLLVYPAVNNVK